MLRTLMVTSSCAGLLAAASAPAGAQQPYGSEQRAFEQVARAVESFGYSQTLAGAEEVLGAAESARNAFAAAEAARDSRHERIHALAAERAPACQNDPGCKSCSSSGVATWIYNAKQQDWLPYTGGGCSEHSSAMSWAREQRLNARHHAAVGEYMDLVGIDGTASAQGLAENTRLYANAFDRLGPGLDSIEGFVAGYYQSANDLHGYAVNAHVALHRAALEAISRAGRAISQAADRLGDDYYGVGIENLRRYSATLDRAVSEARGAERNGEQADRALDSMLAAARQTVAALRTNLEATRRYEAEPDPGPQVPDGLPAVRRPPDIEVAPAADLDAWANQVRDAVMEVERAAGEAEETAAGSGYWFSRFTGCENTYYRLVRSVSRVQDLTIGSGRPDFIPGGAGSEAWRQLSERIDEARRRARAACSSIEPPR